jgi:hypothetical protein
VLRKISLLIPKKSVRIILAFILAPAVPFAISAVLTGLLDILGLDFPGPGVQLSLYMAYPVTFFLGLPLYFAYKNFGWLNGLSVISSGAAIGSIIPLASLLLSFPIKEALGLVSMGVTLTSVLMGVLTVAGFIIGAICGIVFWVMETLTKFRPQAQSVRYKKSLTHR